MMEIRRDILDSLKEWKNSPDNERKPLLLKGARQTGKTWIMESFGKECFEHYVKFDFDRTPELQTVFRNTKEPERLIKELSLYSNVPIEPGRTLIIFDEIQECEEALNSLKYFCEDAPQYHIVAAGSLLGVAVKRKSMSVPVGKVRTLKIYPLTFKEILPWVGGALLLAALVALAVWLIRRRRSSVLAARSDEPPYVVALRSLDRFKDEKYWAPEKQKAYYSGITDILKAYIDRRFGVDAPEMTTDELFAALKGCDGIRPDVFAETRSLFELADFVKFAKHTASRDENAKALSTAVGFVTSTYQTELEEERKEDVL